MNTGTAKPKATAVSFWGLVEVAGALLSLATITGFLARLWWILELTSHCRLHLAIALGAIAAIWALKRRWRWAAACAAFAAVNAVLVFMLLWPRADEPLASGSRLRLLSINVHTANGRTDLVQQFLQQTDADVVLLMEVNGQWMESLSPALTNYAYRITEPREDNFGIALFSRVPLASESIVEIGDAEVPSVIATIQIAGREVTILGTHPLPPGSAEYARRRNEHLREIAAHVRRKTNPVIVLGDLNARPWSPFFVELLKDSGLKDTSRGRGLFASWPAWLPIGRIPLDHCLVSPVIEVADKRLGPQLGSDHLPLVVELLIPGEIKH